MIVDSQEPADREWAADLMVGMDPWVTLGRTRESALQAIGESNLALERGRGFVLWTTCGLLNGYIRTIAVTAECQGQGLGRRLIGHAEQAILRQSPNVFLCVSSFNGRAQRLYERLGYVQVGVLSNLIVPGHDEHLLRKAGPSWREYLEHE